MSCLRPDAENMKHGSCICGFAGICHSTEVKGVKILKCAVVCYFQGTIFNPTNLLNHVAHSIELMMQCEQKILMITALCNNLEHLCLIR